MANYIDPKIIINWWDYYLIKWGIKKDAAIYANTKPDIMKLILKKDNFQSWRILVKAIFPLIKENRLEYYRQANEMVIYAEGKKLSKRLTLDLMAIETVERLLNLHLNFEPFDQNLFIVDIAKSIKLMVRKNIAGDVVVVDETIIQDEYGVLRPYLKDAIVLDIGAYIGDSAIKFILDGAKKVYSYEPHPELYNLADKNIQLNNLGSKIVLRNFGVSDKQINLTTKDDNYFGATGGFGLGNNQIYKDVMLKLLSLDSIILEVGHVDVMKMDCEGAEFPAILACPQETLRKIKVMIIEYHNEPAALISYLEKTGFEVEKKHKTIMLNREIGLLFVKLKRKE